MNVWLKYQNVISYILVAKRNVTPYFFNQLSISLSFALIFTPSTHLWLFNLFWKFQPYRMRIRWDKYKYVACTHVEVKPNGEISIRQFFFPGYSSKTITYSKWALNAQANEISSSVENHFNFWQVIWHV